MREINIAGCCMLATVLGFAAVPVKAAQLNEQFNVTVNLQSANSPTFPQTIFCRTNPSGLAFGATVTVVCSTGAVVDISPGRTGRSWSPMHGGAFRYVTQELWNCDWVASRGVTPVTGTVTQKLWNCDWVESLGDTPGTITSWRIVSLLNRNYLELTVGW